MLLDGKMPHFASSDPTETPELLIFFYIQLYIDIISTIVEQEELARGRLISLGDVDLLYIDDVIPFLHCCCRHIALSCAIPRYTDVSLTMAIAPCVALRSLSLCFKISNEHQKLYEMH